LQISKRISIIILLISISISYANTFHASWHLDDYSNILTNKALHLTDIEPKTLYSTFFANPIYPGKKLLHRPISNFTFALNWYFGGDDVEGYHFVNILIHIVMSIFLFLSILLLYKTPSLNKNPNLQFNYEVIALFATLLWALNPIQTQAVTYIVQRMASLAAMFYVISIFFYLKLRLSTLTKYKIIFICGLLVSILLAIGSKENAAAIPFSLLLIELIFFRKNYYLNKTTNIFILTSSLILTLAASYSILHGEFGTLLKGYETRSFSLSERILTEPRVIIIYLSQLFYPATFRLSLEHDLIVSTSFFSPPSTLLAIIFIIFLIVLGVLFIKKQPLISLSILFYFLNHLIESSFLPLELFFEHRNYLPSIFIFLPVADFLVKKATSYRSIHPQRLRIIFMFSCLLLFVLGTGTYIRNMAWISEQSLLHDTFEKSPNNARTSNNLANEYLKEGLYDHALRLYTNAKIHASTSPTPRATEICALNGIGSTYLLSDHPQEAVVFLKEALNLDHTNNIVRLNLAIAFLSLHNYSEAQRQTNTLLESDNQNSDYRYLQEILELQNPSSQNISNIDLDDLSSLTPSNGNLQLLLAVIHKDHGNFQESLKYLSRYDNLLPKNITSKLTILDVYILQNDLQNMNKIADDIISNFSANQILNGMNNSIMMGVSLFSTDRIKNTPVFRNFSNNTLFMHTPNTRH